MLRSSLSALMTCGAQGMQQLGTPARDLAHPLTLVRMAYGIA